MEDSGVTDHMPAPAPKRQVDWERIEAEYRAGQLSIAEIGRQAGVSHVAILKRAKKYGWTRNLAAKVKAEVTARLVTDGVTATTSREAVELAAERGVEVVRQHRQDIGRGRRLTNSLLQELETASETLPEIEAAIEEETAGDKSPKRRQAMLRAVSLGARASAVFSLSAAMKNFVALERQAFSIPDADPTDDLRDMPDVEIEAEIAALLAKVKVTKR